MGLTGSQFLCLDLFFLLAMPRGLQDLGFPTRDWTRVLAEKALSPNHWTTREVSSLPLALSASLCCFFLLISQCVSLSLSLSLSASHSFLICLILFFASPVKTSFFFKLKTFIKIKNGHMSMIYLTCSWGNSRVVKLIPGEFKERSCLHGHWRKAGESARSYTKLVNVLQGLKTPASGVLPSTGQKSMD